MFGSFLVSWQTAQGWQERGISNCVGVSSFSRESNCSIEKRRKTYRRVRLGRRRLGCFVSSNLAAHIYSTAIRIMHVVNYMTKIIYTKNGWLTWMKNY